MKYKTLNDKKFTDSQDEDLENKSLNKAKTQINFTNRNKKIIATFDAFFDKMGIKKKKFTQTSQILKRKNKLHNQKIRQQEDQKQAVTNHTQITQI